MFTSWSFDVLATYSGAVTIVGRYPFWSSAVQIECQSDVIFAGSVSFFAETIWFQMVGSFQPNLLFAEFGSS